MSMEVHFSTQGVFGEKGYRLKNQRLARKYAGLDKEMRPGVFVLGFLIHTGRKC